MCRMPSSLLAKIACSSTTVGFVDSEKEKRSLLIIHEVKTKEITFNTVKNMRMSDTIKKLPSFKTWIYPPDKWLYNKGILETKVPYPLDKICPVNSTQYPPFCRTEACTIKYIVKHIHSPVSFVKTPFEANQAIFWPRYIWPKRTKSSQRKCHLSFYISIIIWNLVWFQGANFYWNFMDW